MPTIHIIKPEGTDQRHRIIEGTEIGTVIPVADIADMIGYSRSALTKAIKANERKMNPCKTFISLPTTGGSQQFLCLNRAGVDYLFVLIHPAKARMDIDQLLEFRKGILEKLGDVVAAQAAPAPASLAPAVNTIEAEIQRARIIARESGRDERAYLAVAYEKCGVREYIKALNESGSPVVHGEKGWMTPKQLGDRCGLNSREVNSWLYNHGFQFPEGAIWRLQPKGEPYGREYWFEAPGGHREIRVAWREEVLHASGLKRREPETKMLPAATVEG